MGYTLGEEPLAKEPFAKEPFAKFNQIDPPFFPALAFLIFAYFSPSFRLPFGFQTKRVKHNAIPFTLKDHIARED
jgi:hypothetical protein